MKVCPNCHEQYADDMKFCPKCGDQLIKAGVCPRCGKSVATDEKYCPYCGFDLSKEDELKNEERQINRYKEQMQNLERKRTGLVAAGWVLFGVGLFMFILCLIILINNASGGNPLWWIIVLTSFGVGLGELMVDAGVIMFVVGYAVFSKRIDNRKRIISEFESKR